MLASIKHHLMPLFCFLIIFSLLPSYSFGANFPLEIINIKPSGTGTPAIPSTHRIFRAYPGIEYNIRAAVIGGAYPYTYSLMNAPSGMIINPTTGEISWPNPQSNSGTITLTVADSEGSQVSTSWDITVTTSGFWFVSSAYVGTSNGSITQPFKTIKELLAATTSETDIAYFRKGSYQITESPGVNITLSTEGAPHNWIGYPGETANISGNSGAIYANWVYFDGLNFSNFVNYGLWLRSNYNYMTVRRTIWDGLTTSDNVNNNYGFSFTYNEGPGYYLTFQDNEFRNFQGSAIGSLYNTKKVLIEDNYIHSPWKQVSGQSSIRNGIGSKYYTDRLTIRKNRVIMDFGSPWAAANNSSMVDSYDIEAYHNLFVQKDTSLSAFAHQFNSDGYSESRRTHTVHYYRNTAVGRIRFANWEYETQGCNWTGPYYMSNNIIINPNTDITGSHRTYNYLTFNWDQTNPAIRGCINDRNNLFAPSESGVLDENYNLTPKYQSYFGTHGYQIMPTGSNDQQITLAAPTGLKLLSQH